MPSNKKKDSVPKELVSKYVQEFCTQYPDLPTTYDGFMAPSEVLAHRSGLEYSYIWKMSKGSLQWDVSFDAADRIFCAIGKPDIWHCDPDLKDIYECVVAEADRLKPLELAA